MMKTVAAGNFQAGTGVNETVHENRGGFRVFYRPARPVEDLLDHLLPDPDRIIARGEVFKQGSRNHSVRIALEGQFFFLKRYNDRGWGYRLGNLFRRSRAVRTWRAHLFFRGLGLPIQEPVLCLEERNFRLLGRSYLLTEFVDDSKPLVDIWPNLNAKEKKSLLLRLAAHIGHMHRVGGIHGDLKWYNILIRRIDSKFMPILVDLDGSHLARTVSGRKSRVDVGRFLRDLEDNERDTELQTLFLETWQAEVGLK